MKIELEDEFLKTIKELLSMNRNGKGFYSYTVNVGELFYGATVESVTLRYGFHNRLEDSSLIKVFNRGKEASVQVENGILARVPNNAREIFENICMNCPWN